MIAKEELNILWSLEQTAEILQQWEEDYSKNDYYQWAIELNDIEQPIGSISVVSLKEDIQSAELGYCIGKSWWHQGYTTEPRGHGTPWCRSACCAECSACAAAADAQRSSGS